jgi:SAM-dependent methyltransferase
MTGPPAGDAAIAAMQEQQHGAGFDYEAGSPHLRHRALRHRIISHIRSLVAEQFTRSGRCRVLEIGAGHGSFTDHVAATGADVTVTEMSRPSLELLRARFATNPRVRLLYDADGEVVFADDSRYDLVLCVSVLHHVPDYLGFVERLAGRIDEGGAFASFQDPMWYPRRGRLNLALDRYAYYAWRLGQADLRRGIATRLRRARGVLDESNPADMVEYHVVRQGVDDELLAQSLRGRFADVARWTYWSTQLPLLQALGERAGVQTTFGLVARGRLPSAP